MNSKQHFVSYLHSPEETLAQYNSTKNGIVQNERINRLAIYGKNVLNHKNRIPWRVKFLWQFKDLMIILLLWSAGIARRLWDTRTTIILWALVFVNAIIWYFQEAKAERLLEKLSTMVHAKAKVIIEWEEQEIDSADLVPGDILVLNEGDALPADVRIIEERNLQTNDFALTWESNPKRKHVYALTEEVEIGDRTNLCYMWTTIATGNWLGVVVGTWMNTELWRIATLSTEWWNELSPLQKEMNHTAKMLTGATIVLGLLLFCLALFLDRSIHEALLFAIGIAASMVPQWLPAQISIALTSAAGVLANKFALVKKLSAVETLWAVNVICTDKTGTLTTNEMTVQELWFNGEEFSVSEVWYEPSGTIINKNEKKAVINELFELFLSVGVLASNAHIHAPDKDHKSWYVIGDPTEGALLTLWWKVWLTAEECTKEYPLIQEFCFDSNRKRMSMVRQKADWTYRIYVKWSLQTMLPCCTSRIHEWKNMTLNEDDKNKLITRDDNQATKAMRNLTYAYKDIASRESTMKMEDAESWLTFLGMVSMIDPPRETVPEAILAAKEANIKIVVITGDYALTAKAIWERIWLWEPGKPIKTYTGHELRTMSDISVSNALMTEPTLIFSRVSPEDKVRIVWLCKKIWRIVAVTGDGVNDAPALKQADIGVAMGKTGTDVAKEAAEIIILDDSFATLVEAIRQGRIIYQNITKTVLSCITTNRAELFSVLLWLAWNMIWWFSMAITAVQILAIDLIGEMWPLAALSWDPAQPWLMQQPARDTSKHMLRTWTILDIILSWLVMWICGYCWYLFVTWWWNPETTHLLALWQTTTYLTIILCQYVNIFTRRSPDNNFFNKYALSNKKLINAVMISLGLILILFYVPAISHWFNFAPLHITWWLCAISSAIIYGFRRRRIQGAWKKYVE
jgi:P-type Ca2+ transporter type 2C